MTEANTAMLRMKIRITDLRKANLPSARLYIVMFNARAAKECAKRNIRRKFPTAGSYPNNRRQTQTIYAGIDQAHAGVTMSKRDTEPELSVSKLGVLGRIGWMAEQPTDFQSRMAKIGRWIGVRRGQPIYSIGDNADGIFGLGEGLLDVSVMVDPDREVVLHRGTPGFWIGDAALLGHSVRTLGVTAASDCQVFKLPASTVLHNLEMNPRDWMCFYRLSHINVMVSLKALGEVISLPPRALFARALLRLATSEGKVHMTQEELSRMVGMSRTSFRRALAALIDDGVIELDYGVILIRKLAALEIEARATDD